MAKEKITISQALGWEKTLKARHAELVQLRDQNAKTVNIEYNGSKTSQEPQYDAKALDKRISLLAREIRHCDEAVKKANAQIVLEGFERDEDVLGELE